LAQLWDQSLKIKASQRLRYQPPPPTKSAEWIFQIRNIFEIDKMKDNEVISTIDEPGRESPNAV
jgi:hypothetical protein